MQITKISLYSLRVVLQEVRDGKNIIGYTVRPGFSSGLYLYGKEPRGKYIGFDGNKCSKQSCHQPTKTEG